MNRIKKARQDYQNIEIPKSLNTHVLSAIHQANQKRWHHPFSSRPLLSTCASIIFIFFLLVNTSTTFVQAIDNIPILNVLTKLLTIESYTKKTISSYVTVKVPAITQTTNTKLEQQINQEIKEKINLTVEKSEAEARQYYENTVAYNKDNATDFYPFIIDVDYKLNYSDNETLSFVISKTVTYASSNTENIYYNLNLKTGKPITLHQLLGESYKEIINPLIKEQITQREQADANQLFFKNELEFQTIRSDQPFYINENQQLVIVFEEYEIAPGYMGIIEFTLN